MAGLVKRLVIFLLTCGFIYCVPGLLLSYYLIKNPNIAKYPPELVSEVADYFQDYFTFSLRLNLVSVVCFVASIYLWFNPRQQNVQVDVDPGHNNAVELEATAISSAVDLGSQAQQHSDPTALATVGGTRHGTPTAHRSNLMDFDFGPDLDCNVNQPFQCKRPRMLILFKAVDHTPPSFFNIYQRASREYLGLRLCADDNRKLAGKPDERAAP